MAVKELPFTPEQLGEFVEQFPTPFYLYDEAGIRDTASALNDAFSWVHRASGETYVNHFAVKALPNPHILQVLKQEGMGADASSGPEIELSRAVGMEAPLIMFTSNNTDPAEYAEAIEAGAIINLDDINQIDVLKDALGGEFPETISFRYNPGPLRTEGVNTIIGNPEDAKFGVADHQLIDAYKRAKELGVKHFGIHTMVVSNELDAEQHIATARMLFEKAGELKEELDIDIEFANLGGGIGIPYRPGQDPVDYQRLSEGIQEAYRELVEDKDLFPLKVITENGRHVTGPHGYLVTTIRSVKETYRRYVGVDATMADLMRPGMYDAYHHITAIGRHLGPLLMRQNVVGSLCENNDQFAVDRPLPVVMPGDLLVIHDAGAHSRAMGFNYNGKLRAGEVLWRRDGSAIQIRRPETRQDYFATLDYPGLQS